MWNRGGAAGVPLSDDRANLHSGHKRSGGDGPCGCYGYLKQG